MFGLVGPRTTRVGNSLRFFWGCLCSTEPTSQTFGRSLQLPRGHGYHSASSRLVLARQERNSMFHQRSRMSSFIEEDASASASAVKTNTSHASESPSNSTTAAVAATAAAAVTAAAASTTMTSQNNTLCEEHTLNGNHQIPEECMKFDTYNGVSVDIANLPASMVEDASTFQSVLEVTLEGWRRDGRRGVWLTVPTQYAFLVPAAVDLGFDFQHAEKGHVLLTQWLPPKEESRLPHGPTHQVGIGAFVLHPNTGQMVVVQEKTGPAAARKLWKMPTGLTDPGEDIIDAAIREAKEETGLDTTFDRIVCFRQAHGVNQFQKSDLFFVCLLKLAPHYLNDSRKDGGEIELHPQEEEIADVKWVDMEEYFQQELWQKSPLYKEMNEAMLEAARVSLASGGGGGGGGQGREGQQQLRKVVNGDVGSSIGSASGSGSGTSMTGFVGRRYPVGFRPGLNTIYVSDKS